MKILYAIQGTGNGHLSRALDIIPNLINKNIDFDILISGTQVDIKLPYPVKYKKNGISFIFGKNGGIDYWSTFKKLRFLKFINETLNFPAKDYDLIISDFEPISAWAAKIYNIPCISLSHQAAVFHKKSPKPIKKNILGMLILKYYAPAKYNFGFHFKRYDEKIQTPIIRQQVRNHKIEIKNHYTVYLPSYGDKKIINILSNFDDVKWEVFSKHSEINYSVLNVNIFSINNEAFIKSMATSKGVLCGAGFETPSEAMYLGKKLLIIPMKMQYEQQCNAIALEKIGITVLDSFETEKINEIRNWIYKVLPIKINYPDNTSKIIDEILKVHNNYNFKITENEIWEDLAY